MVTDDLNEILNGSEHLGETKDLRPRCKFRDAVMNNGLEEIDFEGPCFTWTNGSMMERLDRAFANSSAFGYFNKLHVFNLDFGTFDHLPIFVTTNGEEVG